MIGIRWILSLLTTLALAAGADAIQHGIFGKKTKSEAQVKRLVETIRSDPDEKKRRAAIAELKDADPRAHAEVIPVLIAALQKEASAQLRAEAADAIGQYRIVYPLAGLALEAAAELDSSRVVRESAQQALWEYHLLGYRSQRGADGIAGQTPEPPIARAKPTVAQVSVSIPQTMPTAIPRPLDDLPPIASQPVAAITRPIPRISIAATRPILSPLAVLRSLSHPLSKVKPSAVPSTPEPPLAPPRVYEVAPAPSPVETQHITAERELELPPISEPPANPAHSALPAPTLPIRMLVNPLAPGPRLRSWVHSQF